MRKIILLEIFIEIFPFDPSSASPTKWSSALKQFFGQITLISGFQWLLVASAGDSVLEGRMGIRLTVLPRSLTFSLYFQISVSLKLFGNFLC